MSETEIINEEPVDTGSSSSKEDKFFGVTTVDRDWETLVHTF